MICTSDTQQIQQKLEGFMLKIEHEKIQDKT